MNKLFKKRSNAAPPAIPTGCSTVGTPQENDATGGGTQDLQWMATRVQTLEAELRRWNEEVRVLKEENASLRAKAARASVLEQENRELQVKQSRSEEALRTIESRHEAFRDQERTRLHDSAIARFQQMLDSDASSNPNHAIGLVKQHGKSTPGGIVGGHVVVASSKISSIGFKQTSNIQDGDGLARAPLRGDGSGCAGEEDIDEVDAVIARAADEAIHEEAEQRRANEELDEIAARYAALCRSGAHIAASRAAPSTASPPTVAPKCEDGTGAGGPPFASSGGGAAADDDVGNHGLPQAEPHNSHEASDTDDDSGSDTDSSADELQKRLAGLIPRRGVS